MHHKPQTPTYPPHQPQASKAADYDRYLLSYAELLYQWGALETRAEVLKRLSTATATARATTSVANKGKGGGAPATAVVAQAPKPELVIAVRCRACQAEGGRVDPVRGVCTACKAVAFRCVVCELAVRGQSMFCLRCAHGGHTPHLVEWFQEHDVCPSGCGCRCVFAQSEELPLSAPVPPPGVGEGVVAAGGSGR